MGLHYTKSQIRPNQHETQRLRHTEFLMGYGPLRSLVRIGISAGLLVGLIPFAWILFNMAVRFLANIGRPPQTFGMPTITSFFLVLPEIVILALCGGALAYLRMLSVRKNRFFLLPAPGGHMRVGLDSLFGIVIGTPLIWFALQRHGMERLLFFSGGILPFLGFALVQIWSYMYGFIVRRLVTVPLHIEIAVTVARTLASDPNTSELFHVESVTWEQVERKLEIKGQGAGAFHRDKNEQRFRETVRNIPIVTQNVRAIDIVDTGAAEAI